MQLSKEGENEPQFKGTELDLASLFRFPSNPNINFSNLKPKNGGAERGLRTAVNTFSSCSPLSSAQPRAAGTGERRRAQWALAQYTERQRGAPPCTPLFPAGSFGFVSLGGWLGEWKVTGWGTAPVVRDWQGQVPPLKINAGQHNWASLARCSKCEKPSRRAL